MAPQCGAAADEGNACNFDLEPKMSFVFMVNCCILKRSNFRFNQKASGVHFCISKLKWGQQQNGTLNCVKVTY